MIDILVKMFLLVDTSDQMMIAFLCVICGYLLRELLDTSVVGMGGFILAFFVGSVVMLYIFRQEKILMVAANEIQVLAAAAVGIAATFVLLGVLFRVYGAVTDYKIESLQKSRRKAADH